MVFICGCCVVCCIEKKKQQQQEEEKKRKPSDKRKGSKEAKYEPKSITPKGDTNLEKGAAPTEGRAGTYTRLRKTSDTDEISLLFEDALEYQDQDIDEILAELAATNADDDYDDGTLKGLQSGKNKVENETKFHMEQILNLDLARPQRLDKRSTGDSDDEKEIMIDCPPYVNMPPPMKKFGDIVMPPCELEYHISTIREDTETIAPPGCATIGHSPTYQRSTFDAFRRHRPQSFDGGTMENQVDVKMLSRLQPSFFLMHGTLLLL